MSQYIIFIFRTDYTLYTLYLLKCIITDIPNCTMHLSLEFIALLIVSVAAAPYTFPSFIISHKLIPGLRNSLPHSQQLPFTLRETNNIVNQVLEECSSDTYLIIDQPGLTLSDFENFKNFVNMRKYMAQASTILTFPNTIIDDITLDEFKNEKYGLDFKAFENKLKVHCNTQTMKVLYDDDNEIPQYIDTRKRLILVELSELPSDNEEARNLMMFEHDELIYKIIRKLPSPYFTIVFTSSSVSEYTSKPVGEYDEHIVTIDKLPDDPADLDPDLKNLVLDSKSSIFPDISLFDKSRYLDFERNEKHEREDYQQWAKDAKGEPKDETWVERKKKVIDIDDKLTRFGELDKVAPSILSKELLVDNALLIAGGAFLMVMLLSADILRLIFSRLKVLVGGKQKSQ